MTLKLHSGMEERLREVLLEELPRIEVQFNRFLTLESMTGLARLDAALSKRSSIEAKLFDYIGEEPISEFVSGVLQDSLWDRDFESDPDRSKLLARVDEYADPVGVAERLIEELKRLPRRYHLLAALPHFVLPTVRPAMGGDWFELAPDLALASGSDLEGFYPEEPPESAARAGLFPRSVGVSGDLVYLRAAVHGYVPKLGVTRPVQEFSSFVRSFFGLGIALRLFRGGSSPAGQSTDRPILVFEDVGERGFEFREPHPIGTDVSRGIEGLRPDVLRPSLTGEQAEKYARDTLAEIKAVFSAEVSANEEVLRAAQWLFDSHCGGNQLLSYVQATAALEILLGDKASSDQIGLGELLRNRCAYLIGSSRSQREEILHDFNRIYATRSRIVHRGKNRLSRTDLRDLSRLRWMCGRVIQEEVELIRADAI